MKKSFALWNTKVTCNCKSIVLWYFSSFFLHGSIQNKLLKIELGKPKVVKNKVIFFLHVEVKYYINIVATSIYLSNMMHYIM